MIQETSLEAYRILEPQLGFHQQTVYEMIERNPNCCNHDLAHMLEWEINRVTPRVKELREKGIIICSGHKTDLSTNRRVMKWRVIH